VGAELIRGTIWTALAFYFVSCGLQLAGRRRDGWEQAARVCWTLGCAAFVLHVLCAFHFAYGWSHQTAVDFTARRTAQIVGAAVGEGVWVSYLFTVLWVVDSAVWWIPSLAPMRAERWYRWSVGGFFVFIIANGTMVFESGAVRWFAGVSFLTLVVVWELSRRPVRGTSTVCASDTR
jgi:hypothetical protein